MNNFILTFIVFVLITVGVLFNVDFSNDVKQIKAEENVEQKEKQPEVDTKIVYEKTQNKKEVVKTNKKEEDVKKAFDNYMKDSSSEMHTLSTTKVGKYTVALKTLTKPETNDLAPPQFPTIVKGEINGNKFNLVLPEEAKSQGVVFTLTSTSNGKTAVVDVPVLQDTIAGTQVDMGNLNPPEEINDENADEFIQTAKSEIEEKVEESKNTTQGTTSIAPPSPPAIK